TISVRRSVDKGSGSVDNFSLLWLTPNAIACCQDFYQRHPGPRTGLPTSIRTSSGTLQRGTQPEDAPAVHTVNTTTTTTTYRYTSCPVSSGPDALDRHSCAQSRS